MSGNSHSASGVCSFSPLNQSGNASNQFKTKRYPVEQINRSRVNRSGIRGFRRHSGTISNYLAVANSDRKGVEQADKDPGVSEIRGEMDRLVR